MVAAHFWLQYEWTGYDFGPLPRQLSWALLTLNFSWTVLLLVIAGLLYHSLGSTQPRMRHALYAVNEFRNVEINQ